MTRIDRMGHHPMDLDSVPERPFVIDGGAGSDDSHHYLNRVFGERPEAHVLCIEPMAAEAAILLNTEWAKAGRLWVWQAYLTASPMIRPCYHWNEHRQWSRVTRLEEFSQKPAGSVDVMPVTLEAVLACSPRVDVLKLDIEGNEVELLEGVSKYALAAIGQINVEWHPGVDRTAATAAVMACGCFKTYEESYVTLFYR
ncbi:MAG TPA: FkbM family methyltransferase [Thiobacillus sp.]|nr:FkbM family methyltransferase [Thiobacillus sp.]